MALVAQDVLVQKTHRPSWWEFERVVIDCSSENLTAAFFLMVGVTRSASGLTLTHG